MLDAATLEQHQQYQAYVSSLHVSDACYMSWAIEFSGCDGEETQTAAVQSEVLSLCRLHKRLSEQVTLDCSREVFGSNLRRDTGHRSVQLLTAS